MISCRLCKSGSQQPEGESKLKCDVLILLQCKGQQIGNHKCTEGEEFGPCVLSTSVVLLKAS